MLSPLDLQNKKVLPRKKKYDKAEMDDYIDLLLENYKEAFNEVQELHKKIKTLSDGIQYYRSIESTMQKALVLAEKTSKETKDAALLKAEAIEKDANTKASKIVSEAEQEYEKIKDKCVTLVQQFNQYKLQLKQVATAQLELVTSESFDVYSPELEALNSSRNSLPPVTEMPKDTAAKKGEPEHPYTPRTVIVSDEPLPDEGIIETPAPPTGTEKEDLEKTVTLPDLKSEMLQQDVQRTVPAGGRDEMSMLTADTIDLRHSLEQLQAEPGEVKEAVVREPKDANPSVPSDVHLKEARVRQPDLEVLEPVTEDSTEAPTLDSLLQSMNIGGKNKKKKKKGQEEDPFEFLSSVDDF